MHRPLKPAALAASFTLLAAVGQASAQDTPNVEKCTKKMGVLAVTEPREGWGYLSSYGLGSPASLLRLMVQSSGCFDVVERNSVAMDTIKEERQLADAGELRQTSNVGKGQMQAADFVMLPAIQVRSSDTGGIGGAVGGALLGRFGLGGVAGGLKFKEASTSLLISDVRSSLQVAAAEGKATKTDFNIGGFGWGGGLGAAVDGYTKTPEGKMIAASLLDNYNHIVLQVRDNPSLLKQSSAAGDANAAASTKANMPVSSGQVLVPKIANVKLYAEPSRSSKVVATLGRNDELVASGEVRNGFAQVDSANGSGWVPQTLVGAGR